MDATINGRFNSNSLEMLTSHLDYICVFSVVPDVLLGLEHSKFTNFDVIMMKECPLMGHVSFFRALRSMRETAPGVAIIGNDEEFDITLLHDGALGIVSVLQDPFSAEELSMTIDEALSWKPTTNNADGEDSYSSL